MIPPEGREKGAYEKLNHLMPSVNLSTHHNSSIRFKWANYFILTIKPNHWMHVWGWWEKSLQIVIEAWGLWQLCQLLVFLFFYGKKLCQLYFHHHIICLGVNTLLITLPCMFSTLCRVSHCRSCSLKDSIEPQNSNLMW